MKKWFCIFWICNLLAFSGCGMEDSPVEVAVFEQYNPLLHIRSKFLKITSKVDSVTITKIIPNRGKGSCRFGGVLDKGELKVNKTLEYGQIWDYIPLSNCDKLMEVKVVTNLGEWNFTFNY